MKAVGSVSIALTSSTVGYAVVRERKREDDLIYVIVHAPHALMMTIKTHKDPPVTHPRALEILVLLE